MALRKHDIHVGSGSTVQLLDRQHIEIVLRECTTELEPSRMVGTLPGQSDGLPLQKGRTFCWIHVLWSEVEQFLPLAGSLRFLALLQHMVFDHVLPQLISYSLPLP